MADGINYLLIIDATYSSEEALAHYAGNDPVQSGTAYLDTVRLSFFITVTLRLTFFAFSSTASARTPSSFSLATIVRPMQLS